MAVIKEFNDSPERIRREAKKLEKEFELVFFQALNLIKDERTIDEIADLLEAGQVVEAMRTFEIAAGLIATTFVNSVFSVAASTVQVINPFLSSPSVFDPVDNVVVAALQQSRLEIIRDFSEAQRQAVLAALLDAAERGQNPRQTAQTFLNALGLTPAQEQAVRRYRQSLEQLDREALRRDLRDKRSDSVVDRAIRNSEPLPVAAVDRLVNSYRERQLRFRASRIARTDSLAAANIGSFEAFEQLLREGFIEEDEVIRTWRTSIDGRERPSHFNLNGSQKRPGEVFQGFAGTLRFPHDPRAPASERVNCRCSMSTILRPIS